MFIYCGQKLTKIYRPQVISHTEDVVMSLMKGKLNNFHSLYMDNFYNSVDLAHKLLLKQTYCTGTLRMNRKNNPKEITSKKLKTGELISKYTNDGICVLKWKDKRKVLGLSTEWKADLENVKNRKGDEKEKPVPIINYNKFMSGVDRQDQMLSYYPCERKTLPVIRELLQKSQEQPLSSTLSDNKNMHAPELLPKSEKSSKTQRKRCRYCGEIGNLKDTSYFCSGCKEKPLLCLEPCFKKYHMM
ncbi:piggyBac transposable element-derived protein 4-like [Myzus persicae]|uniref:piggyBac transposable element-derived protein 4-like n=1 Tax=Myzus persicae TaxID=13164 RepID=UPI000B937B77|nr:piggyBac transposable element-derived protein 4-like [Myzus persicae]